MLKPPSGSAFPAYLPRWVRRVMRGWTERETFNCPYCSEGVFTRWDKRGRMLPDPTVAQIGDGVWHAACWEAAILKRMEDGR
jgi:hypothetical protein